MQIDGQVRNMCDATQPRHAPCSGCCRITATLKMLANANRWPSAQHVRWHSSPPRPLQWVLENYSDKKPKELLRSPVFEAAGLTWHLNVYPKGNRAPVSRAAPACSREP